MKQEVKLILCDALEVQSFHELRINEFISIRDLANATASEKQLFSRYVEKYIFDGDDIYLAIDTEYQGPSLREKIKTRVNYQERAKIRKNRELNDCAGLYLEQDIREIYRAQNGYCYYSGERLSLNPPSYTVDHIVPVSEGGSFWPKNLALCTRSTNSRKNTKSKRKFMAELKKSLEPADYQYLVSRQKLVETEKRIIDKRRKQQVQTFLSDTKMNLRRKFNSEDIFLAYTDIGLEVSCKDVSITFPVGYIRRNLTKLSDAISLAITPLTDDFF